MDKLVIRSKAEVNMGTGTFSLTQPTVEDPRNPRKEWDKATVKGSHLISLNVDDKEFLGDIKPGDGYRVTITKDEQ